MWERFSYYGMRALLLLYVTAPAAAGGLGFTAAEGGAVYALYTSMAYMAALPGGWVADRLIGQQRAVLWGGIIIAAGHFTAAIPTMATFYLGLTLIVAGTGLLKGNVSVIVGQLYGSQDLRRDAGFSIFYMGINLGAFLAPLVCGYLGQRVSWHTGFAAAGVGMTLGVIQFAMSSRTVPGRCRARASGVAGRHGRRLAAGAALGRAAPGRGARPHPGGCDGHPGDHDRGRGRCRRRGAPPQHGRLLRLAVLRRRLDHRRTPPAVRRRRAVLRLGAVLVGLRTGGLHAQPVRRSQHAHRGVRAVVSEQLVPERELVLHLHPGAGLRLALAPARGARPGAHQPRASS